MGENGGAGARGTAGRLSVVASLDPLPMPAGARWMVGVPRMRPWLSALPSVVGRAAERWSLDIGAPYDGSHISWTAPAARSDGGLAVLKVQFPHPECEHEAAALRRWDGEGAVRLLDHHAADQVLLLERCQPGTHLSALESGEALTVLGSLVRRLSVPADLPFRTLEDEATAWAEALPGQWEQAGRPFDRRLVDVAVAALGELTASAPPERVLLHQDLHADNVCRAQREPWLVIDPKPLVGDPAFAPAPIVRSNELGHSRQAVLRRLDAMVDALGVQGRRAAGWAIGQTVAWSIDDDGGGAYSRLVDTAGWLLDRWEGRP